MAWCRELSLMKFDKIMRYGVRVPNKNNGGEKPLFAYNLKANQKYGNFATQIGLFLLFIRRFVPLTNIIKRNVNIMQMLTLHLMYCNTNTHIDITAIKQFAREIVHQIMLYTTMVNYRHCWVMSFGSNNYGFRNAFLLFFSFLFSSHSPLHFILFFFSSH